MYINEDNPLETLISIKDKIPFFESLAPAELKHLVEDVKILTFKNKAIIFNEGSSSSKYIYYLLHGAINILKSKNGSESTRIRIQRIDKPALFGELLVLTGEPRNATVESGDDKTLVLAFKIREFELKTTAAKFYKNVIKELGRKITAMNEKIY
ncbi:MAG: cyclic nucleotide-binding domain-containing protein [Arcobacteraceae bacterium]|jgi:CRP-like cAMP-binding protein|nr:cyclic nucleotide-binding domain-containing protein [Arcobacteraceae bacterium]